MMKRVNLILFLLIVSACGRNHVSQNVPSEQLEDKPNYTGLVKKDYRGRESAYTDTVASNTLQETKIELEQIWKSKNIRSESEKLSKSLSQFKFQIQRKKDRPAKITGKLNVSNESLEFDAELVPEGNRYRIVESPNVGFKKDSYYALSGYCLDSECEEIKLFLSKYDDRRNLKEIGGFIRRNPKVSVQAYVPLDQKEIKSPELKSIFEKFHDRQEMSVEDYVVASGVSTSELKIPSSDKSLCLNISNLQTDTTAHRVSEDCLKEMGFQVTLVGNSGVDEASDTNQAEPVRKAADQLLLIESKEKEKVYLEVQRSEPARETKPVARKPQPPPSPATSTILPLNLKDSRVTQIIKDIEDYRDWDGLDKAIENLLKTHPPEVLQVYFSNIKDPFRKLQGTFDRHRVPSAMFLNTLWESSYFRNSEKFQQRQIGKSHCELGPLQFRYETAKDFKDYFTNIFKPQKNGVLVDSCPNPNSVEINPNDDRLYLVPAFDAGGAFISGHIDRFKDPVVAEMAYNMGASNADKVTTKFEDVDDFASLYAAGDLGWKFSKLAKLRTAGISYGSKFLAIYFIATNPTHYSINPKIEGLKAKCEHLYPPKKQNLCPIKI